MKILRLLFSCSFFGPLYYVKFSVFTTTQLHEKETKNRQEENELNQIQIETGIPLAENSTEGTNNM
jgi:hypothetical protein